MKLQANEELEELRRTSKEAAKIVILYEHLKQVKRLTEVYSLDFHFD